MSNPFSTIRNRPPNSARRINVNGNIDVRAINSTIDSLEQRITNLEQNVTIINNNLNRLLQFVSVNSDDSGITVQGTITSV